MAKVPFSKLQANIIVNEYKKFYCNKNGEEVYYEVKSYLPLKEKIDMVSRIVNQSFDDNGFCNPIRVKLFMTLEIVFAYTNLSFTEKMKEDPFKLYDILISTGIFADVISCIEETEWPEIQDSVWTTIKNVYDYHNSVLGIIDTLKTDYEALNFDASEIQQKLADPENLDLLKAIMTKLA